jgi:hypothetical protein
MPAFAGMTTCFAVIPANAGIQVAALERQRLDACVRRHDDMLCRHPRERGHDDIDTTALSTAHRRTARKSVIPANAGIQVAALERQRLDACVRRHDDTLCRHPRERGDPVPPFGCGASIKSPSSPSTTLPYYPSAQRSRRRSPPNGEATRRLHPGKPP